MKDRGRFDCWGITGSGYTQAFLTVVLYKLQTELWVRVSNEMNFKPGALDRKQLS